MRIKFLCWRKHLESGSSALCVVNLPGLHPIRQDHGFRNRREVEIACAREWHRTRCAMWEYLFHLLFRQPDELPQRSH